MGNVKSKGDINLHISIDHLINVFHLLLVTIPPGLPSMPIRPNELGEAALTLVQAISNAQLDASQLNLLPVAPAPYRSLHQTFPQRLCEECVWPGTGPGHHHHPR
jgi:hypothetical protein